MDENKINELEKNQKIIIESIKGLYENQQIINEKINGILSILDNVNKNYNESKDLINNVFANYCSLDSSIKSLLNKSADVEIQLQNSNEQYDSLSSSISDVIGHIDNLSRSFNQFKVYSEI